MKNKRRVFIIALSLVLLGVVSSVNWREPRYHWKTLSSWLATYGAGPADYKPSPEADHALRQIGSNAVPGLLRLLHSTNSHSSFKFVRKDNYTGLVFLPATTPPSTFQSRFVAWVEKFPYRLRRVTIPASWDHWKAYLAFQALGPEGKSAIPDLVKLAQDPGDNSNPSGTGMAPGVRFWKDTKTVAIFANQSSTYVVLGGTASPTSGFRWGLVRNANAILVDGEIAAWSLAAIGADSVPPLVEMLTNSNPRLRCRAAVALGLMGEAAEPAVPALVKMLHDPDINTRWEATDALGCIGRQPDLVVPALIEALADPNAGMKFNAMESLGDFGERATNAIPALLALFPEGDVRFGNYAASALNKISRDTTEKEVLPFLLHRIKDSPHPYTRSMALETLGQITNEPDLAIPPLIEALGDTNELIRNTAIYCLGHFNSKAKAAMPKLISLTTDGHIEVRKLATNALDKIDPAWQTNRSK
jgi:HEAT repeat protein